jgi:hypothetical protein
MKKPLSLAAAAALLLPAAAEAKQPTFSAKLLGTVQMAADGKSATVQAQYRCTGEPHLWVSVKQMADGKRDPRFTPEAEGTSAIADTYVQTHPVDALDCDGRTHVDKFVVDQTEPAMDWSTGQPVPIPGKFVGKGTLVKGDAWVQFCVTTEQGVVAYPVGWVKVR